MAQRRTLQKSACLACLLCACEGPSAGPTGPLGPTSGGATAFGHDSTGGEPSSEGPLATGGAAGGSIASGGRPTADTGGRAGGGGSPPDPNVPSAGGSLSSSGGSDGSGGDPPHAELLGEFAAFWDFETEEAGIIPAAQGAGSLHLQAAAVSDEDAGHHLALSGEGSFAATETAIIDTEADFSVSAWVNLAALGTFNTFVGAEGQEVSAFFLQKRDDHRLSFTTFPQDSSAAEPCVTTAAFQPRAGQWHHVVGTRDETTREQRIYVDGALSSSHTCPGSVFSATSGITVGRGLYGAAPSDFLSGAIDDVGLIARTLSPEDVLVLYQAGRPSPNHYLFAYFVEVSQGRGDGLRLAHSHDGLTWGAIGANKVFLPPSVGGGSFRDPHVMRAPDGVYHLVWTTTCVPWAEADCQQDRGLGHATSTDLVNWSNADYIPIDLEVEHVWAPETYFDPESEQFLVFWSSPLDNDPSASDPHSIYYLLTSDFVAFSEPRILYSQPNRNFIDATIRQKGDGYLMILKDEADGQKNLRALASATLFGEQAWTTEPSPPLTGNYAAEGPSLLERDDQLFVYFDKYGEGSYGALRATSNANLEEPSSWEDISSTVFFPGVRHGTPIEVPWPVFEQVALEAGRAP